MQAPISDSAWVVVQSLSLVWLFCDPLDCSQQSSSIHGVSQARRWEEVAISFSRGSSPPRDRTSVSCIGSWIRCLSGKEAPVVNSWRLWRGNLNRRERWKQFKNLYGYKATCHLSMALLIQSEIIPYYLNAYLGKQNSWPPFLPQYSFLSFYSTFILVHYQNNICLLQIIRQKIIKKQKYINNPSKHRALLLLLAHFSPVFFPVLLRYLLCCA